MTEKNYFETEMETLNKNGLYLDYSKEGSGKKFWENIKAEFPKICNVSEDQK